jgi:hypothetical protein
MDCCICSKPIAPVGDWTQGNDAWPVADGRCCNQCDMTVVVQARLMEWAAGAALGDFRQRKAGGKPATTGGDQ